MSEQGDKESCKDEKLGQPEMNLCCNHVNV